jgi:CRISPR-associated protein Cas2
MWVLAMFDLPVLTPRQRKVATRFRKDLVDDGFDMLQFSVYARHCANGENADVHVKRIVEALPGEGEVRVIEFTDKQWERMRVYHGKKQGTGEKPGQQLEMF